MPAASASRGERGWIGRPATRTSPASRGWTPVRTLIRVLLPAHFSPIRAWTSPARAAKATPSSAVTPGNRLVMPLASRTAPVIESILAGGQGGGGLGLVVDPFLDHDPVRDGLAGGDRVDQVEELGPEERIAFDGAVELALGHGDEGVVHAVDRDDDDVLARLEAGLLDRLDRAQGHVVVVGEERGD